MVSGPSDFKPSAADAGDVIHVTSDDSGNVSRQSFESKTGIAHYTEESITDSSFVENGGSGRQHIFQDAEVARFYADLYEKSKYEGRHHFDPEFEWEPKEERKIVLKNEWYVCFWAFLMFFALDIDRYNMGNAVSGTLFEDLGITTTDYNLGNTINLVCFLSAELPSQLISKKLGPDRWIPTQITLWSIVAISQCAMKNRTGFLVTRALIGLLEGGFIPDTTLWMSYFYTGHELAVRISYFYIANPLTQAFSSLLAYGIFHIKGSWSGWRWLFLIEGIFTLVIGIISFFKMPPSAVQTRTWFRKNGWFTEREEKIIVNRILRDDPSKGDMHNRQALDFRRLWKSVTDYDLWPLYIDRIFIDIIGNPLSRYLPIILKDMGFSTLNINLLMIPPQFITIVTMLLQAHSAKYFKEYAFNLLISPLWLLPCVAAMHFWPQFLTNHWGTYALLIIALGAPPSWALTVTWSSQNSNSVGTRTVSASLVNMCSQVGGIIGSNVFRADDAPKYHRGTGQLFAIAIVACLLVIATRYYYVFVNKRRERIWNSMSETEKIEYLRTAENAGNRRLDFRFST